MRRLLVLPLLVAAAACAPQRVPVNVHWTFGGNSCADAGVASVQIDVAGELLAQNKFTCAEAPNGVQLGDFLLGPYDVTVTGFDSGDNLIYQSTQRIQVTHGSNDFTIDAAPTTGTGTLHWTFAGKSCAAAGVSTVRVSVDNQVITDLNNQPDLPCTSQGVDGTTIGPLSPGSHTFAVAASAGNTNYSSGDVNANVVAGQDTLVPVDLAVAQPTTASADLTWDFQPGGLNCAQAGADHLYIVFDPAPNGSGGTVVADTPCQGTMGPVSELSIVDVPDGNHSFAVRATRQNNLIGYTHQPVSTLFTSPFTTAVHVTVESTP